MPDVQNRWGPDELELSRVLHLAVDDAAPTGRPVPTTSPVVSFDLGRRRRWVLAAVPAVAACLVAAVVIGIGLAFRDEPAPAVSPLPAPVLQDPGVLRGSWSAELWAGRGDVDLTATVSEVSVSFEERGCTVGYWFAVHPDGLLVLDEGGQLGTGKDPCAVLGRQQWMTDLQLTAQFVVQDADHVLLLDDSDGPIVELTRRGAAPTAEPGVGVIALPAGLVAPSRAQLLGTWFEEGLGLSGRTVHFERRTWTYSQSVPCNSTTEYYALSDTGGFVDSRDPNLRVEGCGARLPAWLGAGVTRLGLDGEVLVLLDAAGGQLARLDKRTSAGDSLLDRVQGGWTPAVDDAPVGPLWLRVEDEWLRHAFNASCNTAEDEVRLSFDGWVVGSRRAGAGGCEPGGAELVPRPIDRVELVGDELVLLDAQGNDIVRLVRDRP